MIIFELHCDRFIPNNANDQQFQCSNIRNQETGKGQIYYHSSELEYQDKLAYACGLAIENRILAFKIENHQQQHHQANYQCQKNDLLKQVYGCQSKYYIKNRIIPTNPELILDAPGIVDDYYLNLLDWSNKNMVAIGLNEGVYLWNADTGEVNELSNISSIIDNNISSLSWSEDGDHLAVGLSDGDTQIWDILTAQKVRSMSGHATRVGVMAWNRQIIASGCKDSSIWKHDIRLAQHKFAELLGHTGEVCGLKWRSDGEQLASGGNDNKVNIWDAKSSVPKFTKTGHKAAVKAIAWCPWQRNLLATGGGSADRQIHFWNTDTLAQLKSIDTQAQVTSIVWSNHYKEVLSTHGYQFTIWKYPSLKKVIDVKNAHENRILQSALSPEGEIVATVAGDECLKFWRIFQKQRKTKNGGTDDDDDDDYDKKDLNNLNSIR
nr:14369_t:CDS:2 [Entrophospora candida]CAG8462929.1 9107_t:CDS:2 [Entrophospora candida]